MKQLILVFFIFSSIFFFAQKNQNYLQIGYASICCGTPSTIPVTNYVKQYQKKNKTKAFEILQQQGMGMEGEFNLYISTDQLAKSQKTNFIKGLHSAIAAQNTRRNQNSDGIVNFEASQVVKKADLLKIKNLIIYKK